MLHGAAGGDLRRGAGRRAVLRAGVDPAWPGRPLADRRRDLRPVAAAAARAPRNGRGPGPTGRTDRPRHVHGPARGERGCRSLGSSRRIRRWSRSRRPSRPSSVEGRRSSPLRTGTGRTRSTGRCSGAGDPGTPFAGKPGHASHHHPSTVGRAHRPWREGRRESQLADPPSRAAADPRRCPRRRASFAGHGVSEDAERSAIIGVVELVDCTQERTSRWHEEGSWGWYLAGARRFRKPVPMKGQRGLFEVPDRKVAAQLGARGGKRRISLAVTAADPRPRARNIPISEPLMPYRAGNSRPTHAGARHR